MTRRASWRSVVLAVLMLGSVMSGAVGPAMGQSAPGTHQHSWSGAPGQVVVDVGDYQGQVNIQFTSSGHPDADNVIWAGTLSGYQLTNNNGRVRLLNRGAYESVSVTVSGPSTQPGWDSGGVQAFGIAHTVGSTGGDTDTDCGYLEESSPNVIDCVGYPGITSINTTETDANQTQVDLYGRAQELHRANDDFLTTQSNALEVSANPARSEGQAAYYRALANGSTEAAAQYAAITAAEEYYAVRQRNLLSRWNSANLQLLNMRETARNESGISANYVGTTTLPGQYQGADDVHLADHPETYELRLADGSKATARTVYLPYQFYSGGNSFSADYLISINDTSTDNTAPTPISVEPYDSTVSSQPALNVTRFNSQWNAIQQSEQTVEDDMITLVNNTYDEYQSGQYNVTDFMTAGTAAQEYSPGGDFDSWAAWRLAEIGVGAPSDYEQTGSFVVNISDGPTYTGMLYSASNPPSGEFERGQTYDPATINGTQILVYDNTSTELTRPFTLENITNAQDETVRNVTIERTVYETTNASELAAMYRNLTEYRQAIEAREQALINNSGVPPSEGSDPPIDSIYLIAGAGALLVVIIIGNQT